MATKITCDFPNEVDEIATDQTGEHLADFVCRAKHAKRSEKSATEISVFKTVDTCTFHLPEAFKKLKDAIRHENFSEVSVVKAR